MEALSHPDLRGRLDRLASFARADPPTARKRVGFNGLTLTGGDLTPSRLAANVKAGDLDT